MSESKVIAVDFDGTIVTHKYPRIGHGVPSALRVMRRIVEAGHSIVLYTMRSGDELAEAIKYVQGAGIPLYGVNANPSQSAWTESPKAYAHAYIDDAALGCPLVAQYQDRPYVDWLAVEAMLVDRGWLAKSQEPASPMQHPQTWVVLGTDCDEDGTFVGTFPIAQVSGADAARTLVNALAAAEEASDLDELVRLGYPCQIGRGGDDVVDTTYSAHPLPRMSP